METIPASVLERLTGAPGAAATSCEATDAGESLGVVTGGVTRLSGTCHTGGGRETFSLIRKNLRPLTSGRHAIASREPDHWAYWRREALAYESGVLPTGPGLRAPRCFGVVDDAVYLEDVDGEPEKPVVAAARLGRWQATAKIPQVPWLSGHQLAQRVAVSELDWSAVDADPRMPAVWNRRGELLDALARLPKVLSHGDFHSANLLAADGDTVAVDWCTLGLAPPGADLAHLQLASREHLAADPAHTDKLTEAYLDGLCGRFTPTHVETTLRVTIALTGASRVHWMLASGHPLPTGYVDFVAAMSP
ncbi:phosphotransferase [Phytomonospora endophytica]|uniref:Aminoglycoside phosphotransferase domain-containing protein n=1 Tax=Phytomonospora endophytica TaxID=714109 RepID=A0A841FRD0_9ACTN|nr:phosphotransferase [Phytomonospora endophytica]MBB6035847.1 hypothetical protein [Phytomonospora endophytica]